jgi:hypothetical protein
VGLLLPGVREERNFIGKEPTAGSAAKGIVGQLVEKLGEEEIRWAPEYAPRRINIQHHNM